MKRKRDEDSEEEEEEEEEPVLSHAEKRRQKKKEKAGANKKSKLETNPPKRQNSVWVGNLLFRTTEDGLRHFFDGIGEITRIHMPSKPASKPGQKPENRGFAYVDFANPEAKTAAIALSEQPLFGRKLLIKDGDDFTGRPGIAEGTETANVPKSLSKTAQKILRSQKQLPGPTLFLGNLGFNATEDSIRQLFDSHRDKKSAASTDPWIKKVRMGTFEDSGLCKGFAFVDFSSIEHATSALVNSKNHHLDGRDLVVEYASPDAVRRGASKPQPSELKVSSNPQKDRKAKYNKATRPLKFSKRRKAAGKEGGAEEPKSKAEEPESKVEEHIPDSKEKLPSSKPLHPSSKKKERTRPKPGAALAQAKRQSAAILPNSGPSNKIKF